MIVYHSTFIKGSEAYWLWARPSKDESISRPHVQWRIRLAIIQVPSSNHLVRGSVVTSCFLGRGVTALELQGPVAIVRLDCSANVLAAPLTSSQHPSPGVVRCRQWLLTVPVCLLEAVCAACFLFFGFISLWLCRGFIAAHSPLLWASPAAEQGL